MGFNNNAFEGRYSLSTINVSFFPFVVAVVLKLFFLFHSLCVGVCSCSVFCVILLYVILVCFHLTKQMTAFYCILQCMYTCI